MTRDLRKLFISLVRLGIGHEPVPDVMSQEPCDVDWVALKALAAKQGLSAVVLDGIAALPSSTTQEYKTEMPQKLRRQWIGEVIRFYENRYEQYEKAISSLAGFYNQHGYKMMVLKGYACSLDWPKPNHRQCGDIDIWLFNQQAAADKELVSSRKLQDPGFKIDNSHHHHTVFRWKGFSVENHYDFVNVHAKKSNKELEVIFKELGDFKVESSAIRVHGQLKECSDAGCKIQSVIVNGEVVYLPSPDLHALFLIRHMVSHFVAAEITLRQVLDWAFFVEKLGKDVDWDWLIGMVERFQMKEFFDCINAICVTDLGFGADIFPYIHCNPILKERVLIDILSPAYGNELPKDLLPRLIYKFKRWQGNAWKQKLCYRESRFESFFIGLWAKVLKPASI